MGDGYSRREFVKHAGVAGLIAGGGLLAQAQGAPSTQLAPPDAQPPDLNVPKPPGKKAGYALVGLGEFCLGQVMPQFAQCEKSRPVALVSGHPDKAKKVAEHYGISPKAIYDYKNFDAIRDNAEVDVVYVILPNSMHAEYSIRAAKAGKHVLCEKPMAVSVEECQQMVDASKAAGRKLMIAYRQRYEPFNQTVIEMTRKKAFGEVKVVEAENIQNVSAPNIRLSAKLGGGPLGDVGVYCLNACRYVLGEEPTEVSAMVHRPKDDPRFAEVAESVTWQMRFPSGALAHCSCGFGGGESRRYRVQCADGWYEMDPAFAYSGLRLFTHRRNRKEEIVLPQVPQVAKEMDHFSDCVLNDRQPWTPGEDGMQDVKIMARIMEAAEAGKTLKV